MHVKAVKMTFNFTKRLLHLTSNMYIFSVLVTDDPNWRFAVKPAICNLKTHAARLHDCTRLWASDHEDLPPPPSVHTALGHLPIQQWDLCVSFTSSPSRKSCIASVLRGDPGHTRGSIIWLVLLGVTGRKNYAVWWSFFCYETHPAFGAPPGGLTPAGVLVLCPLYCYAAPATPAPQLTR